MSLLQGKGPQGKAGLLRGGAHTNPPAVPGAEIQGDKGTNPPVAHGKRTDYQKKAYYVGLRHQDALDDMAKALRRHNLPDDRSMIVRALIDLAAEQLEGENAGDLVARLAAACRRTLPGTTKAQGD